MRPLFTTLAAASMLASSWAIAQAAEPMSAADRSFVAMVSQGGMFEVQLGKLAAEQGNTQDIRDQGNTEAHDHQLVGDKLKSIATAGGLTVPDTLNAMFQQKLDAAKALSGAAFDARYLSEMKTVHDKDGAAFAQEAKGGTNPQLKQFAAETHRIVVMHIGELKAVPAEK